MARQAQGRAEEEIVVLPIDSFTARIEGYIDWYRSALGLSDYRFEVRGERQESGDRSAGSAYANEQYPTAIIRVREHPADDATWMHNDHEEVAVHEMIHVLMEPMIRYVEGVIGKGKFSARAEEVLRTEFENQYERVIERIAWGMVACAHADRDGTPPVVGKFMPRTDTETK